MENQKLVIYIREQIEAGHSPQYIESFLISNGYDPKIVREAIKKAETSKLPPPPLPRRKSKEYWPYIIIGIVIVSLLIIGAVIIRLSTPSPELGSASTCRFILNESQRDDCYLNVSFTINDTIFCKYITNNAKRDRCYYEIQKGVGDCTKISNNFLRGNCYYLFARRLNNASLCSKIEGSETKKRCINYFNK